MNKAMRNLTRFLLMSSVLFLPCYQLSAADENSTDVSKYSMPDDPTPKMDVDFDSIPIQHVLRVLSMRSGIDIIAGPEITGTVTLHMKGATLREVLIAALEPHGYVYKREDNMIKVMVKNT